MPSFRDKKHLKFVITLGTGKFGSSDNNRVTLQGLRASVEIDKAGGVQMSTLRAKIYGVSQDDMNSVTTLQWKPQDQIKNTVEVYAVYGTLETLVFAGNIVNAWGDYQSMPDVYLHIQAQAAYFASIEPVRPISIPGGIDVAIIMMRIANDMGLQFENNGVHLTIVDAYVANTLKYQAIFLSQAMGFDLYIDDATLAITPKDTPRDTLIPRISKDSGLVGYPTFDGIGVNFRTLFNPAITFGGAIKLETDIKQAAGQWNVVAMRHQLESEKPGGAWFTQVRGSQYHIAVLS